MTNVNEAVERVRACVVSVGNNFEDDKPVNCEHFGGKYNDFVPLTWGDLRALLSALELGRPSKDAIVQIIDPEGWEKWNSLPANYRGPVVLPPLDAIAKAEKILALSVSTNDSEKGRLDAPTNPRQSSEADEARSRAFHHWLEGGEIGSTLCAKCAAIIPAPPTGEGVTIDADTAAQCEALARRQDFPGVIASGEPQPKDTK